MGSPPEPRTSPSSSATRRSRAQEHRGAHGDDTTRRSHRRRSAPAPHAFPATVAALEALVSAGCRVSVCVSDLDQGKDLLAGDEWVTLPVAQLGLVPLLIEVAARGIDDEVLSPEAVQPATQTGVWRWLGDVPVTVSAAAALAAAVSDPRATNALIARVGLEAVRARTAELGLTDTSLLDRFRDVRGPDDAPHLALSTTRDATRLFTLLATGKAVSREVSDRVIAWLTVHTDLGLAAAATGRDPLAADRRDDALMLVNTTGRDTGVRAEAGVLAGPSASVAYAMVVHFTDDTLLRRLQVEEVFRVFGADLMEAVH